MTSDYPEGEDMQTIEIGICTQCPHFEEKICKVLPDDVANALLIADTPIPVMAIWGIQCMIYRASCLTLCGAVTMVLSHPDGMQRDAHGKLLPRRMDQPSSIVSVQSSDCFQSALSIFVERTITAGIHVSICGQCIASDLHRARRLHETSSIRGDVTHATSALRVEETDSTPKYSDIAQGCVAQNAGHDHDVYLRLSGCLDSCGRCPVQFSYDGNRYEVKPGNRGTIHQSDGFPDLPDNSADLPVVLEKFMNCLTPIQGEKSG